MSSYNQPKFQFLLMAHKRASLTAIEESSNETLYLHFFFCIAKEVLSRGISKLVNDGQVSLIHGTKDVHVPSHCFYVDDLMVFCKWKNSSLIAFKELFTKYAACSGQIININKSFIYVGGISDSRLDSIVNMLGFYTGVSLLTILEHQFLRANRKWFIFN